jgi:hypothetical protein
MTPEMLDKLATDVAQITGIPKRDAVRALETRQPSTIKLAQDLVELDNSREDWHSAMQRHRLRLTGSAA